MKGSGELPKNGNSEETFTIVEYSGSYDLFGAQSRLLESIFGREWLVEGGATHAARRQYRLCRRMEEMGGATLPLDEIVLPEIAKTLLDSMILVRSSGGDYSALRIGAFERVLGLEKAASLKSRLQDSARFEDFMTELAFAAWHLNEGHAVQFHEAPGMPDFVVAVPGLPLPLAVECKRIVSRSPNRLLKEVQACNRQVKNFNEPCIGVGYLDISGGGHARSPNAKARPAVLPAIGALLDRQLKRYGFRSLGAISLTWDDWYVEPGGLNEATVHFRRNPLEITRPSILPLPLRGRDLFKGFTVSMNLVGQKGSGSA